MSHLIPLYDDDPVACDAFRDGPGIGPRCREPALFEIHRSADTVLFVCPTHLGHVLAWAETVVWPPRLDWAGVGSKPPHALTPAEAQEREDRLWQEITDDR